MHTTYHLTSAQEISTEILDAIKIAYKSRPITITIEEDVNFEISDETKKMLDFRLKDYLQNSTDVEDLDVLLDQLEQDL